MANGADDGKNTVLFVLIAGTGWWSQKTVTWWQADRSLVWCWCLWHVREVMFVWTAQTWRSCDSPSDRLTNPSSTAGFTSDFNFGSTICSFALRSANFGISLIWFLSAFSSFVSILFIDFLLFLCCRVFGADIQGRDCGDEASRWLTRYLGAEKTFRLVHFEPQMKARRPAESEPLFPKYEVNCPDFMASSVYLHLRQIMLFLKSKPGLSFLVNF